VVSGIEAELLPGVVIWGDDLPHKLRAGGRYVPPLPGRCRLPSGIL
jgi:hypothetical protein